MKPLLRLAILSGIVLALYLLASYLSWRIMDCGTGFRDEAEPDFV